MRPVAEVIGPLPSERKEARASDWVPSRSRDPKWFDGPRGTGAGFSEESRFLSSGSPNVFGAPPDHDVIQCLPKRVRELQAAGVRVESPKP